jgi:flap endonuclease-1
MGIKEIKTLIKKHSPNGITTQNLINYANKKIAVDISIYFYRFLAYGNHLSGFVRQILILFENNITPLYVFDGKPPVEKSGVLLERKLRREKDMKLKEELEEKIKLATSVDEIKVLQQKVQDVNSRLIWVTAEHINSAKELFNLFGVPYLEAIGEAEILCAKLCQEGYVDACMSEDTDLMPNGACIFINDFKVNNKFVQEYKLDVILKDMKLSYTQFVDLCILCGCDYTCKIEGLAKDGAYTMIKKYQNIEGVINFIKFYNKKYNNDTSKAKYIVSEEFDYQKARNIFLTPLKELILPENIQTLLKPIDANGLQLFVQNKCDKLAQRYSKQISKLCKDNKLVKSDSINQFSLSSSSSTASSPSIFNSSAFSSSKLTHKPIESYFLPKS